MKGKIIGFSIAIIITACGLASAQTCATGNIGTPDPQAATSTTQAAPARAAATSGRFGRLDFTGIPAGALWVREGDSALEPRFDSYTPGGAVRVRLTDLLSVEGEAAWAIGRQQDLKFHDQNMGRFKTPNLFGYSGNLLVNLLSSDHRVIPYAIGGIGGLHLSSRSDLGVGSGNFLTGDVGAGAKVMWGQIGVRGDYRFFALHGKNDEASSFVGTDTRFGNRLYAGVVFAPGRSSSR